MAVDCTGGLRPVQYAIGAAVMRVTKHRRQAEKSHVFEEVGVATATYATVFAAREEGERDTAPRQGSCGVTPQECAL